MITLEQVEKLRERTGISYEEARKALEETNGDLLEVVINLEKQGRIQPPSGGGYYSSQSQEQQTSTTGSANQQNYTNYNDGTTFSQLVGRFFRWCGRIIHKGNINTFEVVKDDKNILMVPVTVLVLLLIFAFWITIPVIILGLFFGYRYVFKGPDLEKTQINDAMDSVANATDNLKKEMKDHQNNHHE